MNVTGCPPGLATDEALFYENTPMSCDMNISAFFFIAAGTISIKLIVAIGQTILWIRRERRNSKNDNPERRRKEAEMICGRKLPIFPLISWIGFVILVLLFVLMSLNIANKDNGFIAFLCGLIWMIFCVSGFVYLHKFVSLGSRIASPGKRWMKELENKNQHLNRFDNLGRLSLVLCYIAAITSVACYSIFSLIFPGNYLVIQFAFAFQGWYVTQISISILYHIQRVKKAIAKSRDITMGASPENAIELGRVHRKLTEHQFVLGFFAVLSGVFYAILVFKVVPARYFIFTILIWIEVLNALFVLVSNLSYLYRKSQKSDSNGPSNQSSRHKSHRRSNESSTKPEVGHHNLAVTSSSYSVAEGNNVAIINNMTSNNAS